MLFVALAYLLLALKLAGAAILILYDFLVIIFNGFILALWVDFQ